VQGLSDFFPLSLKSTKRGLCAALPRPGFAYGHCHNVENVLRIIFASRLIIYKICCASVLISCWRQRWLNVFNAAASAVSKAASCRGRQRYKCTVSGYHFINKPRRGRSQATIALAVWLYLSGLSQRRIARRLPCGRIALDQKLRLEKCAETGAAGRRRWWNSMRCGIFLKKSHKVWLWKASCPATGQLIDWECGGRDRATLDKLLARLKDWNIQLYCTDDYAPYDSALPVGRHHIGKDLAYQSEQNNSRQHHWYARFKRHSLVVSHSMLMIEPTMRLFAAFHVNGTDAPSLNNFLYMIT
jgi:insertion element IS1 protein InsB